MTNLTVYKKRSQPIHGYACFGTFPGNVMHAVLASPEVAAALGAGVHEVFAVWQGRSGYGKRFTVTVPATKVTVEEIVR